MTTRSSENRVPTETFLLPGQQQFCVQPWEIANLPRAQVAIKVPPAPQGTTLDDPSLKADPFAGVEIGACQVIRKLTAGSAKTLLAVREDPTDGASLVVLRKLEVPEGQAREIVELADSVRRFRHPNLGRVFAPEACDEGIFWVSEYTSGATLAELFEVCKKLGKGLPIGLALGVIHEAAQALGELHVPTAVSHGLISDQSVAISFDGTARLADVGLFKCVARQGSWAEVLEATGPYLSPEQILKGYPPDTKCDVYALAAVLYECLSGQKLARATNYEERVKKHLQSNFLPASSLNVSLGKQLDEVLAAALSPDRSKRYPNALEFAKGLKQAASSFIWRPELRAEFLGKLFETRKRREQVLLAGCAPKRSLTSPALAMPAIVLPSRPSPAKPPSPPAPTPRVAVPRPLSRKAKPPRARSSHLRPLCLTLVATALAWVAWGGEVPVDLDQAIRGYGAPPPVPFVIEVAPPAPATPVAQVAGLACVSEEPAAPAPAEAVVAQAENAKPAPSAVRAVKHKKAADELPSAPWLTPHGRKTH